jgi:hypothetical protein
MRASGGPSAGGQTFETFDKRIFGKKGFHDGQSPWKDGYGSDFPFFDSNQLFLFPPML